jgi:hypothetical protein
MERMRISPKYAGSFRRVLEMEGLLDVSQFDQPGFFDEIPLYSRTSQLSFLPGLAARRYAEIDRLLLEFSLNYLDWLLLYARPREPLFAALTFFKPGRADPMVPSIFVCHGKVEENLLGHLSLQAPRSPLASRLKKDMTRTGDTNRYIVLQDDTTISGEVRVFVGERSSVNLCMVTIDELKADLAASHEWVG